MGMGNTTEYAYYHLNFIFHINTGLRGLKAAFAWITDSREYVKRVLVLVATARDSWE